MELTSKQRQYLKGLAHHLKPVVQVGDKGISSAVIEKTSEELENHELIKVKVDADAKDRAPILADGTGAAVVQVIGRVVVLYRARKKKPAIRLPA
ncbi:MAG: ribosome assembly RNA-binding protein YhbY [Alphaproteobacteria bacterium]|nr:ribosome assembly RNA-binding protein YhbY [Alphaproteobacteria bacterium]